MVSDSEYNQIYETYLLEFINEVFVPNNMSTTYDKYYQLIKDYAYAEESGYTFIQSDSDFDQAVSTLKSHVQSRTDEVTSYLN